jgi:UDP-glucuronate 4-epimerase
VFNIGNHTPVEIREIVRLIEEAVGRKAIIELAPMQAGDVPATYADVDDLAREVGFTPATPVDVGVRRLVDWFRHYHRR